MKVTLTIELKGNLEQRYLHFISEEFAIEHGDTRGMEDAVTHEMAEGIHEDFKNAFGQVIPGQSRPEDFLTELIVDVTDVDLTEAPTLDEAPAQTPTDEAEEGEIEGS